MIDEKTRGYLLALVGAVIVSPDAVLIRLATDAAHSDDVFVWIIALKCLFTCVLVGGFIVVQLGIPSTLAGVRAGPLHILLIAFFQGTISVLFPVCFQMTTTANALLLISLNPVWAALLGWRILGDLLSRRIIATLLASVACVCIIFIPPAVSGGEKEVPTPKGGCGLERRSNAAPTRSSPLSSGALLKVVHSRLYV